MDGAGPVSEVDSLQSTGALVVTLIVQADVDAAVASLPAAGGVAAIVTGAGASFPPPPHPVSSVAASHAHIELAP